MLVGGGMSTSVGEIGGVQGPEGGCGGPCRGMLIVRIVTTAVRRIGRSLQRSQQGHQISGPMHVAHFTKMVGQMRPRRCRNIGGRRRIGVGVGRCGRCRRCCRLLRNPQQSLDTGFALVPGGDRFQVIEVHDERKRDGKESKVLWRKDGGERGCDPTTTTNQNQPDTAQTQHKHSTNGRGGRLSLLLGGCSSSVLVAAVPADRERVLECHGSDAAKRYDTPKKLVNSI